MTDEPTTSESQSPSLSRKALIVGGAVVGIIIAGGFAFLKKRPSESSEETDSEIGTSDVETSTEA